MNVLLTYNVGEFVEALRDSGHVLYVVDNALRHRVVESESVHAISAEVVTDVDAAVRWLKAHAVDVVYAQGRSALVVLSRARRRLGRSSFRIVATCHTGYVWGVAWKALAFLVAARVYGDGVVFLAKAVRDRYAWFGGLLGLRAWTVRNPVDVGRFGAGVRRRNGGRDLHLGSVAIITPDKSQDVLVRAARILHDQGYPVSLTLVGDVFDEAYYRQLWDLVAELGLRDSVTIVPGLDYGKIPAFLETLDCYLCASCVEVLPFSILEAMASGLPIVSTAVGGIPDLVQDGRNGLLVERRAESVACAVRKLVDEGAAGAYGAASREMAMRFSNEEYRRQMEDVWRTSGGRAC